MQDFEKKNNKNTSLAFGENNNYIFLKKSKTRVFDAFKKTPS